MEAEMFSVWSVQRLYKELQMKPLFSSVQFSKQISSKYFTAVPDKFSAGNS
jgi:hypothetical protein